MRKGVMPLDIQGTRKRGRPRQRWKDKIKEDVKEKGTRREQTQDGAVRRRLVQHIDPTSSGIRWGKTRFSRSHFHGRNFSVAFSSLQFHREFKFVFKFFYFAKKEKSKKK